MPELPEVETVRRGVEPHISGRRVLSMSLREPRLRWPVDEDLPRLLKGKQFGAAKRRGKYLLLELGEGHLMVHLGMSGRLYLVNADQPAAVHDHIDWYLDDGHALRYSDPRRFGSVFYLPAGEPRPKLLDSLGPEPLSDEFDGDFLYQRSRGRKSSVKTFLMDSHLVVGVGNIYANEALFMSGILPSRAAGRISLQRYRDLAAAVKQVLQKAIAQGGTTLRDFVGGDGKPGYFAQELQVYGKAGKPCPQCKAPLTESRLGQRSTVFCRRCQR